MIVNNCWQLYRQNQVENKRDLSLLNFRREVVQALLPKYSSKSTTAGRPKGRILPASTRVKAEVRFDRIDHYQVSLETQKRCAVCKKNTRKGCNKCKHNMEPIGLHDHCMAEWHGY